MFDTVYMYKYNIFLVSRATVILQEDVCVEWMEMCVIQTATTATDLNVI